MLQLIIDKGPDKGAVRSLDADRVTVVCGRRDGADLVLHDHLVSGRHFRLIKNGEQVAVEDLGSTNGIYVNGERVTRADLKVGDVIQAGETYLSLLGDSTVSGRRPGKLSVPGYTIDDRIGVGGMGVVYRARQISLDRVVALKILSPKMTRDRETVDRFVAEARAAGQLTHANVVQVHDVGESGGTYFICMEFVGGGSLTDLLRDQGRLEATTAARIARDVAKGLDFAEQKGLVHCDIKPENIMLTEDGLAKIADLGIARRLAEQEQKEHPSEVLGSPHYMAPEQARGQSVDHRTDLYALGCTLFRMLAGRTPFSGASSREIMKKQVFEEAPDLQTLAPDAPAELIELTARLMRKDPTERLQHAKDLVVALDELIESQQRAKAAPKAKANLRVPPPPAMNLRTTGRIRRQKRISSSGAFLPLALGAILCGFGVYVVYWRNAPDPGLDALRRAERMRDEGRLEAALASLQGVVCREAATRDRVHELERELDLAIRQARAERTWQGLWQRFLNLKADRPGVAALRQELDKLEQQYGHLPEKKALIDAERRGL